jgi:protein-disulfide isomerase
MEHRLPETSRNAELHRGLGSNSVRALGIERARASRRGWAVMIAAQLLVCACGASKHGPRDPAATAEIDLTSPGSDPDERGLRPASAVEPDLNAGADLDSDELPRPGIDFPIEVVDRAKLPAPTAENPSRGPNDARVVVQVFSDFECPFCSRVHPVLRKLEQIYPGQIRITWRNFPLASHPHSRLAARASLEAFAQGGANAFWRLHDRIFDTEQCDEAMLIRHAEELRLDMAKFKQSLNEKTHDPAIDRDIAAGLSAGVLATPTVLVNQYQLTGTYPLVAYRAVVEKALSEAR